MDKKKLFIGNLSYDISDTELANAFSQAGTVTSAQVITDKFSGRSKGFGFVEMSTEEEALAAIDMWHEKELQGRALIVNVARPKVERPREGGRFDS